MLVLVLVLELQQEMEHWFVVPTKTDIFMQHMETSNQGAQGEYRCNKTTENILCPSTVFSESLDHMKNCNRSQAVCLVVIISQFHLK